MATSGSTNFALTRDDIITVALRRINELGTGETPSATRVTECAMALNMIMKEWQADGMQLWQREVQSFTPVASTTAYVIGTGQTVNITAPLRVLQAYYRNTSSGTDTPLRLVTREEYDSYSAKSSTGTPIGMHYTPPGATTGNLQGTLTLFPAPDATFAAAYTIRFVAIYPLDDFDASTDNPDCPSFYYNALTWALADSLSYESGLPLQERSMITSKAERAKEIALSLDQEEGSVFFQPARFG
jgi:hypothetical protein